MDQAIAEPALPFFIEWARGTKLPGEADIRHPAGKARISRLVLLADPNRLAEWLGTHQLPIDVRPGTSAVREIHISSDSGEIVMGSE